MSIRTSLDTAFQTLLALQNDPTPLQARDSAWHGRHLADLATVQEAVMELRTELGETDADHETTVAVTETDAEGTRTHFES